jgi:hypothetical protein
MFGWVVTSGAGGLAMVWLCVGGRRLAPSRALSRISRIQLGRCLAPILPPSTPFAQGCRHTPVPNSQIRRGGPFNVVRMFGHECRIAPSHLAHARSQARVSIG